MKSPNQSTAKTFLNVTIFKPLEKNPIVGLPQAATIDITDLLKANGVESIFNVNAVSTCDIDEETEYVDTPIRTRFVVDEINLSDLCDKVTRIVDASIVNQKQSEAVKGLIVGEFDNMKRKCWDNIHPTVL